MTTDRGKDTVLQIPQASHESPSIPRIGHDMSSLSSSRGFGTNTGSNTSGSAAGGSHASLQSTFFDLVYLTSGPQTFFIFLQIAFMFADWVQLLSFCCDGAIMTWTEGTGWATLQRWLSYSRVSSHAALLGSTTLLALGLVLLGFFLLLCLVCYLVGRAIQASQVPNMALVRAIRVTIITFTTAGFIPAFSTLVAIAVEYAGWDPTGILVAGGASIIAGTMTGVVLMVSLIAAPSSVGTANPLARMHSRVDAVYILGKAVTVVLFQIPALRAAPLGLVAWLAVFIGGATLLSTAFIPYYSMPSNVVRVTSLFALLAVLSAGLSPYLAAGLLLATPLSGLLPIGSYLITYIPIALFRRSLAEAEALPTETARDRAIATLSPPALMMPFQVEVAVRHVHSRVLTARHRASRIKDRLPLSIMELPGPVATDGALDRLLVDPATLTKVAQLEESVQAEIRAGLRIMQFCRARWRRRSFSGMAYILFTAAHRWEMLRPAVEACHASLAAPFWIVDVRYFRYICLKNDALNQDTSVMQRLEEQRNIETLRRSQKQLFEQLRQFWAMVSDSGAHRITVKKINAILRATTRISVLYSSVEKLYGTMLAAPTPATLQAYAHYITIVHGPETAGYSDELRLMAEDLNIRRADGETRTVRVGQLTTYPTNVSNAGLHVRAVLAVIGITCLFGLAIMSTVAMLQLCRHVTWQLSSALSIQTSLQAVGVGLSALRAADSTNIVGGSIFITGPLFSTLLGGMSQQHLAQPYTLYPAFMTAYLTGVVPPAPDPYAGLRAVSLGSVDTVIDIGLRRAARAMHSMQDQFREPIPVTRFISGAPQPATFTPLAEYVAEVIHTVEGFAACLALDGTPAAGVACQTPALRDTFRGYEATFAATLIPQFGALPDDIFRTTQAFPLLELALFMAVTAVFVVAFTAVSLVVYVIPVAHDVSFTVNLVGLFSRVPRGAASSMTARFKATAVRERSASMLVKSPPPTPRLPEARETAPTVHSNTGSSRALLPHGPQVAEVPELETDSSSDTQDSPVTSKLACTGPNSSSCSSDRPTMGRSKSGMLTDTTSSTAIVFGPVRPRRHFGIRARFIARQVPPLAGWLAAFAALFAAMAGYAVYRTSAVSQMAESIYIIYKATNDLRLMNEVFAANSWINPGDPAGTAPVIDAATVAATHAAVGPRVSAVLAYLTGGETSGVSAINDAWGGRDTTKAMVGWVKSVFVHGQWYDGLYSTEIDAILYTRDCTRIVNVTCALPRPDETRGGLINTIQAYIQHSDTGAAELAQGPAGWGGPGTTFVRDTMELDMTGGMLALAHYLRERFTEELSTAQRDLLTFFAVFLALMLVFYLRYFFNAIVKMTRTRRQFAVLFRSLPRATVPSALLDRFLEHFPDDDA